MRARDRGQAAVEFAITLPIVIVMTLGVVQLLVVGSRQIALEHAARNGARAASVAADPTTAARGAIGTSLDGVRIEVERSDDSVTVTVRYTERTTVPVVGRVIGDVELSARATMPREPP